ncbi:unnamed protein product [Leptidea sinapis]|uniref:Cytochrome b5 heme-binding domain-containing protein n=1 Tax=Leptidea sinapis TaxID=189913 RepID=A0A5E4Q769_9NEOP|nr:unnamed protein product [Leptidea sinapis]
MDRIITLNEVAKHKNQSSVWIIIHDSVYDVTSYLEEHPGGSDILLEVAGKDGTQGFEDIAHSDDARELLKKYKVGVIDPTEIPTTEKPSIIECSKLKWAVIALAGAVVIGFAMHRYLSK